MFDAGGLLERAQRVRVCRQAQGRGVDLVLVRQEPADGAGLEQHVAIQLNDRGLSGRVLILHESRELRGAVSLARPEVMALLLGLHFQPDPWALGHTPDPILRASTALSGSKWR